eukprot:317309-Rhodomonas_salina.5
MTISATYLCACYALSGTDIIRMVVLLCAVRPYVYCCALPGTDVICTAVPGRRAQPGAAAVGLPQSVSALHGSRSSAISYLLRLYSVYSDISSAISYALSRRFVPLPYYPTRPRTILLRYTSRSVSPTVSARY